MKKEILALAAVVTLSGIGFGQNQTVNGNLEFASEYNSIQFPEKLGYSGGITGDDGNYKRLTLYHGHSIAFETGTNSRDFSKTRMYINAAGNVGIGTTNPSGILDIKTKNEDKEIYLRGNFNSANQNSHSPRLNFVGDYQKAGYGIQAINVNAHGRKDLVFYSHNANDYTTYNEAVRFTHNGNVGIGMRNPVEILQIANAFAFHDGGNKVIGFGYVPRTGADLNSNGYASEIRLDPVNGKFKFGVSSSQSGNPNSFSVMTLTKEQRVGIGTQSPDEKLTVKGKIHAEEVRVDLSVPADYVFEKYYTGKSNLKTDYTMPTLEEVEAFTKANNHLPDVPSAKEIQEEGLHLKEMTNLLLQKVEELTLYTIEQEKQLKEQATLLKAQQKEIQILKNKLN